MATFRGTSRSDKLTGTWFNDLFESSEGNDFLHGGPGGSDTVSYATNPGPVRVDLDNGFAEKYQLSPTGGAPVLSSTDTLTSIENVIGSRFGDNLDGNDLNNRLEGRDGNDSLEGEGGDDTLVGGRGADQLDGDEGSDTFVYLSVEDSRNLVVNNDELYDLIMFFESGVDKIDLTAIDANTALAGDQQFTVVSSFTGSAGQLVLGEVVDHAGNKFHQMLLADVNGDAQGDFAIEFDWWYVPSMVTTADILL